MNKSPCTGSSHHTWYYCGTFNLWQLHKQALSFNVCCLHICYICTYVSYKAAARQHSSQERVMQVWHLGETFTHCPPQVEEGKEKTPEQQHAINSLLLLLLTWHYCILLTLDQFEVELLTGLQPFLQLRKCWQLYIAVLILSLLSSSLWSGF